MSWQEGAARALIGVLCAVALLIILAPHDDPDHPAAARVLPCMTVSRFPAAHC